MCRNKNISHNKWTSAASGFNVVLLSLTSLNKEENLPLPNSVTQAVTLNYVPKTSFWLMFWYFLLDRFVVLLVKIHVNELRSGSGLNRPNFFNAYICSEPQSGANGSSVFMFRAIKNICSTTSTALKKKKSIIHFRKKQKAWKVILP